MSKQGESGGVYRTRRGIASACFSLRKWDLELLDNLLIRDKLLKRRRAGTFARTNGETSSPEQGGDVVESTRLQRRQEERELKKSKRKSLGLVTLRTIPYIKTMIDLWLFFQ